MLKSSDHRHNFNCYLYLQQLVPFINNTVLKVFPELSTLTTLYKQSYDANLTYGNFYTFVLTYLEQRIDLIYPQLTTNELQAVDDLLFAVYHNDNHILEDTEWFKKINTTIRPRHNNAEQLIAHSLEDNSPVQNKHSPKKAESLPSRFITLFTPNFKPQLDTNIPSIKRCPYPSKNPFIEYRIATQGQRHAGQVRVSPLFKRWLAISAQKCPHEQPINHIYFNNLGIDRGILDIPGSNEKVLSTALHELEDDAALKTAVITLPASKALMGIHHYKITHDQLHYDAVFNEMLQVVLLEQHANGIVDLKISRNVRTLLFGTHTDAAKTIGELLTKSFVAMGIKPNDCLCTAQKQAVWLHFLKFELTHYILRTLKPISCNFSCKDAIDRGVVSSVYYHLHYSFLVNQPLNREDFERDLDIAAANVKGRGMNFHRQVVWNALDAFINANYRQLLSDNKKSWLIYWRDMNCPHARAEQLLGLRLTHYKELLDSLPSPQKAKGLKLLASLQLHYTQKVSGQRLLLEVLSRSIQLLTEKPSPTSIEAYKNLAHELEIKHPQLLIIAGFMLSLLGTILFSSYLKKQGSAKINAGFFARERIELCRNIENNVAEKEAVHTDGAEAYSSSLLSLN